METSTKYIGVVIVGFWALLWVGLIGYFLTNATRHNCNQCFADYQLPQCHRYFCSDYLNA